MQLAVNVFQKSSAYWCKTLLKATPSSALKLHEAHEYADT